MTTLDTWDRTLFLKISAGPGAPEALLNTAIFIATDAIYVIPLMLVAMWVWGDEKKRGLALFACVVAFVGLGLNQAIGLAWQHPRPFVVGLSRPWLAHVADSSFPSDHMIVFAGVGITCALWGASGRRIHDRAGSGAADEQRLRPFGQQQLSGCRRDRW